MAGKPGDWYCGKCMFVNFQSRTTCKNCGDHAPTRNSAWPSSTPKKSGDWNCTSCSFLNFASRSTCKNCGAASTPAPPTAVPPPASASAPAGATTTVSAPPAPRATDWPCGSCGFLNFGSRTTCKNCSAAKSSPSSSVAPAAAPAAPPASRPGDWTCKCSFSNFGTRVACMQCGSKRPDLVAAVALSAPPTSAFDQPPYWSGDAKDAPHLVSSSFMLAHVAQVFFNAPSVKLEVESVVRIENLALWHGYRAECERVRVKWATSKHGVCPPLDRDTTPAVFPGLLTDTLGINEVYLMHATSRDVAAKIIEGGFDPSFSGSAAGALFGAGTYFSDSLDKCSGYTRPGGAIIVARVVLGDANGFHQASAATSAFRRPPMRGDIESDSVVGWASKRTHKEFIVYRHTKAYPEFVCFLKS